MQHNLSYCFVSIRYAVLLVSVHLCSMRLFCPYETRLVKYSNINMILLTMRLACLLLIKLGEADGELGQQTGVINGLHGEGEARRAGTGSQKNQLKRLIKKEIVMETNNNHISTWDRVMMAITFAEVGEHDTARELFKEKQNEQRPETRNRKVDQRPELRA